MVSLRKNVPDGMIGEVHIEDGLGEVISRGRLEKIGSNVIVHIDAADIPEAIIEGFSLGREMFKVEA